MKKKYNTDDEKAAANRKWVKDHKNKKKRIDMLVDPDLFDRWQTYLSDFEIGRENALKKLLEKSGY